VPALIGAIFRRVADEAVRVAGSLPDQVVLTHPATSVRSAYVLSEAARKVASPTSG